LLLIDTELTERKDGESYRIKDCRFDSLGIKDSAKIATFTIFGFTIYNYRSLLKKAKGPREEFESKVLQIGSSNYN
jgi:hypothetical protein